MSHSSLRRFPAVLAALALLLALGSCSREPASASTTLFAMDTLMDLAFKRQRMRGDLMNSIQTNLLSSNGLTGLKGAKGVKR